MSSDFICNNHDKIIKLAEQIERLREQDFNDIKETLDEIQFVVYDIRILAEEAKEMGMSMESRLEDYSSAITELGFERRKG